MKIKENERRTLTHTSRIGIINRGEAARRFIRAVKEYNNLFHANLSTVTFHIDVEHNAPFAKEADMSFFLSRLKGYAHNQGTVYLNKALMLDALRFTQCNAVWVGWGFLAEDADFARMIEEAGLVFIGPSSHSMSLVGDKISAKNLAQEARVPVVPWSKGCVNDIDHAYRIAHNIGYPLIIKAAHTGGGRGIRLVKSPDELSSQYREAREETLRTAGNGIVFIEHLIEKGRHLEVQILADRFGNITTYGVRDCSLQRCNQKIIEETPPPSLDDSIIKAMEDAAIRLIKMAYYESAGTVEFLYDTSKNKYYFMQVNTSLQVEHPITEVVYNVDLVKGQIQVAMGQNLGACSATPHGVAIEARLNAEDPSQGFTPAPGKVTRLRMPEGAGIRVDSGIECGSIIPAKFDSMIAKIIAYASHREEAMSRLVRALEEVRIKLEGGTSNKSFLIDLLKCPEIRRGPVYINFVDHFLKSRYQLIKKDKWDIALLACAIEQCISHYTDDFLIFKHQWYRGGQSQYISISPGCEVTLRIEGHSYLLLVRAMGNEVFHLRIDNQVVSVKYTKHGAEGFLFYRDERYIIQMVPRGDVVYCEVNGDPYPVGIKSDHFIKAPCPSVVLSIAVSPGQSVHKGDVLVELEAMKILMAVESPKEGRVVALFVREGDQVGAGQRMLELAVNGQAKGEQEPSGPRMQFKALAAENKDYEWNILKQEVLAAFLGYDYDRNVTTYLERMLAFVKHNHEYGNEIIQFFLSVFEMYISVEKLFSTLQIESENFAKAGGFQELLMHFFLHNEEKTAGLPAQFLASLEHALTWYPREGMNEHERYIRSLFHIYKSHATVEIKQELLRSIFYSIKELPDSRKYASIISHFLDEITLLTQEETPFLADAASQARYYLLDSVFMENTKKKKRAQLMKFVYMAEGIEKKWQRRSKAVENIIGSGSYILFDFVQLALNVNEEWCSLGLEFLGRYFTRDRKFVVGSIIKRGDVLFYHIRTKTQEYHETIVGVAEGISHARKMEEILHYLNEIRLGRKAELILLVTGRRAHKEGIHTTLIEFLNKGGDPLCWCCLGLFNVRQDSFYFTYTVNQEQKWQEDLHRRSFNPLFYRELRINLLAHFDLKLLYRNEDVCLVCATAKKNQHDERLFALMDVSESRYEFDQDITLQRIVGFEYKFMEAVYAMSAEQSKRKQRLFLNRIIINSHPPLTVDLKQHKKYASTLKPRVSGLGIEEVTYYARRKRDEGLEIYDFEVRFKTIEHDQVVMFVHTPSLQLIQPVEDNYALKLSRTEQIGIVYPYEIIRMLTNLALLGYRDHRYIPLGDFEEFDITLHKSTGAQEVTSVKGRPYGHNTSNVVFGIITNYTLSPFVKIRRVIILVDATLDMGALAEPECRRIIAALDLAHTLHMPVEWLPISSGAKIDMQSGTENLDWTARVLKRIIEFTHAGGEINIIVAGINTGAQSYWNAEATMLMHTKGLLIMTERSSMLLTGKKALDFSGSVSAENNIGIGGVERIMGPNGEAQIRVKDLNEAYSILFHHYNLTYAEYDEIFPKRLDTSDKIDRDICLSPYSDTLDQGFSCIGDIFSNVLNPERKKPFKMRSVMKAVIDQDHGFFERWDTMKNAETSIVWETRVGGFAVCMIGIESRTLIRVGRIPYDGPELWNGGTLYPLSSKKLARAINAFSGRLPVVIMANLSGFDGSPESLRKLQLEYGAEIGRAVVNFKGPIILVVLARYHGGAYVVFSRTLNPFFKTIALEGSYASVIGGAPAAAVIFTRAVLRESHSDQRIIEAKERLENKEGLTKKDFEELFQMVYSEKQHALSQRFDQIHTVERAKKVGSIDAIVAPSYLRPCLIKTIEEGMTKYREWMQKNDNLYK